MTDKTLICQVCNKEFEVRKKLHYHIKKEGFYIDQYYQKFFPKYDLHTGSIIKYKNPDQYFNSDFNDRRNFKQWFIKNHKNLDCKKYCYNELEKRIKNKNLAFIHGEVELRSLLLPTIEGWKALGGLQEYLDFCLERDVCQRFDYNKEIKFVIEEEPKIYIDSRERTPLSFSNSEVKKLDFGDYTSDVADFAIERKSVGDLANTLSSGYERFEREVERSSYLVVLVEEPYKNCINYRPRWGSKQKVNGSFIFHRIRKLMQTYYGIQFLFVNSREESERMCKILLRTKTRHIENLDLQYNYDFGGLQKDIIKNSKGSH